MKKIVCVLLAVVMMFGMVGCGEPKPDEKFTPEAVAALEAAIETLDAFLAYDMSAEEAHERLEKIADSLGDEDFYDRMAGYQISAVEITLFSYGLKEKLGEDTGGMSKIRESRDSLYDFLYGK